MPTRRRKFSVQNEGCRTRKPQGCQQQSGIKTSSPSTNTVKTFGTNNNPDQQSPNIAEYNVTSDINAVFLKNSNSGDQLVNCNKNDHATCSDVSRNQVGTKRKVDDSRLSASRAPERGYIKSRDSAPLRHHRAKVRSPKRRIELATNTPIIDYHTSESKFTSSSDLIMAREQDTSMDEAIYTNDILLYAINIDDMPSTNSIEGNMCRICHSGDSVNVEYGQLISACSCRGTVGRVHVKCLERWLTESGKSRCELCGTRYVTRRVHKYGVVRALVMWMMSHNAKQLIVDSLGIMLMSPLAILAAWLSGRTLAGLMSQDSHVTPWPLASTFVLACMTLVCYYCWIVSAATRHALRWWLWYRAQYEVRLEIHPLDEN